MNKYLCYLLLIAATTPWTPVLRAQESDGANTGAEVDRDEPGDHLVDLLELDVPVIVSASRREQPMDHVPYAMSVITADDIRRSGARTVTDALRLVPGVDVAELSYGMSAVSPRGFHGFLGRQALVLVDGRQIFDSHFGGTLWGSWPFQLEDIDHIEVIRGPAGVTWGANAVNGVINIITKDPADQLGVTITSGGGNLGSHKHHFGYGHQEGKLRMRLSGEYEGSDGFTEGGSILRKLDDRYRTGRFGLHAIYDHSNVDTLTFSLGHASMFHGFPPTPLSGIGLVQRSESQTTYLLGKWRHELEEDNWYEITTYVNDFRGSAGIPIIDYDYQQFALQLAHSFKPIENHTLTWGIDSRFDWIDGSGADPSLFTKDHISTGIVGVYIQDEWQFAPKWQLDLGGRIDYEFYGGFQPSMRAALSYELNENSLVYGSASRAFQMTPAGLRFLDMPIMNGLAQCVGHRDVDAEQLIAYELGYRTVLLDRIRTQLVAFWHEFDDLTTITPYWGPPSLILVDFDNRAAASMYGVELDLRYPVTDQLTLLGNYTFQQFDWRSAAAPHDKDMMTPPSHKFMVAAHYDPTDDVHLGAHLYYVDATQAPNPSWPFVAREIDPYFRLDLRAEYEFWDDRASLALGVRNLLDSSHPEGSTLFLNDAEVPRMVYAEFRVVFK